MKGSLVSQTNLAIHHSVQRKLLSIQYKKFQERFIFNPSIFIQHLSDDEKVKDDEALF